MISGLFSFLSFFFGPQLVEWNSTISLVYFLAIYIRHSLTVGIRVATPRQSSFSLFKTAWDRSFDTFSPTLQVSIDWTSQLVFSSLCMLMSCVIILLICQTTVISWLDSLCDLTRDRLNLFSSLADSLKNEVPWKAQARSGGWDATSPAHTIPSIVRLPKCVHV